MQSEVFIGASDTLLDSILQAQRVMQKVLLSNTDRYTLHNQSMTSVYANGLYQTCILCVYIKLW